MNNGNKEEDNLNNDNVEHSEGAQEIKFGPETSNSQDPNVEKEAGTDINEHLNTVGEGAKELVDEQKKKFEHQSKNIEAPNEQQEVVTGNEVSEHLNTIGEGELGEEQNRETEADNVQIENVEQVPDVSENLNIIQPEQDVLGEIFEQDIENDSFEHVQVVEEEVVNFEQAEAAVYFEEDIFEHCRDVMFGLRDFEQFENPLVQEFMNVSEQHQRANLRPIYASSSSDETEESSIEEQNEPIFDEEEVRAGYGLLTCLSRGASMREIKYRIRRITCLVPEIGELSISDLKPNFLQEACTCRVLRGSKRLNAVRRLIRNGCDPCQPCNGFGTLLYFARTNAQLFDLLICNGVSVNETEPDTGRTGLHLLHVNDDRRIRTRQVKRFLQYSADVTVQDNFGLSAVTQMAAEQENGKSFKALLNYGNLDEDVRLKANVYEARAVYHMVKRRPLNLPDGERGRWRRLSRGNWVQALQIRESRGINVAFRPLEFIESFVRGVNDVESRNDVCLALKRKRIYRIRLGLRVYERIYGLFSKPTQIMLLRYLQTSRNKTPIQTTITVLSDMLESAIQSDLISLFDVRLTYVLAQYCTFMIRTLRDSKYRLDLIRNRVITFDNVCIATALLVFKMATEGVEVRPNNCDMEALFAQVHRLIYLLVYMAHLSTELLEDEMNPILVAQIKANEVWIANNVPKQLRGSCSTSSLNFRGQYWKKAGVFLLKFSCLLKDNLAFGAAFWEANRNSEIFKSPRFSNQMNRIRFMSVMKQYDNEPVLP